MNHYRLLLLEIARLKYREDTQGLQINAECQNIHLIEGMNKRDIHESSQLEVFVETGVLKK